MQCAIPFEVEVLELCCELLSFCCSHTLNLSSIFISFSLLPDSLISIYLYIVFQNRQKHSNVHEMYRMRLGLAAEPGFPLLVCV